MTLLHLLTFGLVAAVMMPLVLLLLYIVADRLGLPGVNRLLDATMRAMILEFALATAVNVIGGLAIVGLALWGAFTFAELWQRFLALALMPIGPWRIWRGVAIWLPRREAPQSKSG